MNVRAFTEADYDLIAPSLEDDRAQYKPGAGAGLREAGPAVTLLNDAGTPIAAVGIILLGPGCGAAWGYITPEARSRSLRLVRMVRRLLAFAMKRYGLHHVESLIHPSFTAGPRWMKVLGFKASETIHHPTLQKEFTRYVRVP